MIFSDKFICAGAEFNTIEKHVSAPLFRKTFRLDKPAQSATITVSGMGFYELYVNGTRITKGCLAPYISNPDNIIYYDFYDITKHLRAGDNVLGFILGNGMQNPSGGFIWGFDKAAFRSSPKLALTLVIDGSPLFNADKTFKTHPSPITFDDLRCGERYNANKELPGWNTVGFNDSKWVNAIETTADGGDKKLCTAPPIAIRAQRPPVKISGADGGYIYDFGINDAGSFRLNITGIKGQCLEILCFESLRDGQPDASAIGFRNRTKEGYNQNVLYTLSGAEREIYTPYFSYFGFRYIYVKGITEAQAVPELFTYLAMSSDLRESGGFNCSDETINTLQDNARRSALANFYYFPTDCPHREKNGWSGDASLSAEYMILNYNVAESLYVWLDNIRKEQLPDGSLSGIIPSTGHFPDFFGPGYDGVIVNLPYYLYKYYNNISVLRDNADAIYKSLCFFYGKRNGKGLISFGLGDWCQATRKANQPEASTETTNSVLTYELCVKSAEIFDALFDAPKKAFAAGFAAEIKKAIRENLIDFSNTVSADGAQSSQALMLYHGIFTPDEEKKALAALLKLIADKNDHLNVGIMGLRVLFHVLSRYGEDELAYKLITQESNPSFGYQVKQGATTLWETFFEYDSDNNVIIYDWDCNLTSMNHHFHGDISAWFIKTIGGINLNPHFNKHNELIIAPKILKAINNATAYYHSIYGKITVEWQREETGSVTINVTAPKILNLTITPPAGIKTALKTKRY